MKFAIPLLAALVFVRPGVGKCEPLKPPLCDTIMRIDTGTYAECSAYGVPEPTYRDFLACTLERDRPCIDERARADNAEAELEVARSDLAATEAARLLCEESHLPPEPPKAPPEWYARGGFWAGVGVMAAAVGGAFATEEHPAWYVLAGAGAGFAFAEAVR